ncbi:MAG TPA: VTT domain-containing protein [Pyrinomonadaceae bacterium]|jgi:membrane protein YqaA with SNARE-associated domain|nr:VTT domain-containing protein [Pyrinomonadaceae bacterium]
MYEWLAEVARYLHDFIKEVPIYYAAPAMVVIGALDSSLLSLPEINDYLVVARCYSDPKSVFYFPLFAAAGSVIGCNLLYTIMRRGGQAVMRRRFSPENIARVERAYARFGILALAIPALLPPPMPFKIFVATAGALEFPRWRFVTTIMIARTLRYAVEGALAVFYGEQVIDFMREKGPYVLSAVAALLVVVVAVYVVVKRIRAPRRSMMEKVPPETGGAGEG